MKKLFIEFQSGKKNEASVRLVVTLLKKLGYTSTHETEIGIYPVHNIEVKTDTKTYEIDSYAYGADASDVFSYKNDFNSILIELYKANNLNKENEEVKEAEKNIDDFIAYIKEIAYNDIKKDLKEDFKLLKEKIKEIDPDEVKQDLLEVVNKAKVYSKAIIKKIKKSYKDAD